MVGREADNPLANCKQVRIKDNPGFIPNILAWQA